MIHKHGKLRYRGGSSWPYQYRFYAGNPVQARKALVMICDGHHAYFP